MGFEKMKDKAAEDLKQFRKLEGSSDQTERQKAAVIEAALRMLSEREREVLREFLLTVKNDMQDIGRGYRQNMGFVFRICID